MCSTLECFAIYVKAIYNPALIADIDMITTKLNEDIIISCDPIIPIKYAKIPTTAPAISTKTNTRVIPFFKSAFSPEKCPALNRKPIKKITQKIIEKRFEQYQKYH